jgi:hypothetical protein
VRFLVAGVLAVASFAPGRAFAEPTAAELVAEGEQIAKQGRYTEAIERFKAADRLEARASHACLIALAYTRRELWSQALIFLDLCESRAKPGDPLPSWLGAVKQQMTERLKTANVAPVELVVAPATLTGVTLTVSSFLPDEQIAPRTIHLPPGRHVIVARTPDDTRVEQSIEIADRAPRTLVFDFTPKARPVDPIVVKPDDKRIDKPIEKPVAKRPRKVLPFALTGAGGALVLTGAVSHLFWFKPARDELVNAVGQGDRARYDTWEDDFDRRRTITLACYATGAVALGVGLALNFTVFRDREAVALSAQPHEGGAVVTIGWQR